MMKTMWSVAGASALLAATCSLNAAAAEQGPPPAHDVRVEAYRSYVSGGDGDDSARWFKTQSAHYPLTIELFQHAGARDEYTADAMVKIVDHTGRVMLDAKAEGPFMLVRLPAGEYRVSAALDGKRLAEREIKVSPQGHAKTVFVFGAHTG